MKETRKSSIKKKVLDKADLKRISQLFEEEFNKSNKLNNNTSLVIRLQFTDNSSVEVDSFNMLTDGEIIDIKKTKEAILTYYDFTENKSLNLNLRHGNDYISTNELIITGQDLEWIKAKYTSFEDIFRSIKDQNHFFMEYNNIFRIITSIILGSYVYQLLLLSFLNIEFSSFIIKLKNKIPLMTYNEILYFFALSFIFIYLSGNSLTYYLFKWVNDLWPNIEFNFGPQHSQIEKQRRKRLGALFTIVIIPIIINILS